MEMRKPILIIVTGRPGAGKTTLAETLSREWYLPMISRDRIKEGYVHTQKKGHEELSEDCNLTATNAFFDAVECMIDRGISCIAEAAFQHKVWAERLRPLMERARIHVVVCRVDGQLALDRFLERGAKDPARLYFHGDRGVRMAMSGQKPIVGTYDEPHMELPTHYIDTTDGYCPLPEELRSRILD